MLLHLHCLRVLFLGTKFLRPKLHLCDNRISAVIATSSFWNSISWASVWGGECYFFFSFSALFFYLWHTSLTLETLIRPRVLCCVFLGWGWEGITLHWRELFFIEVNLLNFRCLVKPSSLCRSFSAFKEMLANKSDIVFDAWMFSWCDQETVWKRGKSAGRLDMCHRRSLLDDVRTLITLCKTTTWKALYPIIRLNSSGTNLYLRVCLQRSFCFPR